MRLDFLGLLTARGFKLAVGLATIFVYARMFGVSATYDAWVWSLGIVNAATMILFGPITETIRASYTAIDHKEGRPIAEEYIATVALMMIGATAVLAAAAVFLFPIIVRVLYSEQPEQASLSAFFLYALMPSLLISQAVAVLTAHLNCRGSFFPPEIAGIVGGAVGVLFIVLFPALPALWVLPISYYIGLVSPLLVGASFWPELTRAVLRLKAVAFRRHAREALVFSLPLLLPYALSQVSGLIERQFALQAGTGVLAILSYALFARNTVQAVFSSALSALAVPSLTRSWSSLDRAPFWHEIRHWAHQCLVLLTMGMIALFGLSSLAPVILFGGDLGTETQLLLTELLRCYSIALVSVILYLVGGSALLGARRGKTYAFLGTLAGAASTLLVIALFPRIGVLAIPIALGLSHAGAGWLMLSTFGRAEAWWIIKRVVVCVVVIGVAGSIVQYIDLVSRDAAVPIIGRLAICLGVSALLCGLWWLLARRQGEPRVSAPLEPGM
ncbi:lipid II flippase MurJ [Brevundimonas sp.]|uniref:lipid II flippase MurJ n=1 Tax=Brevundimonas sp. TaxID=1871086 RepID=UPI002CA6F0A3|nr:lipid II flippase MurJ [Brevundimonas sp.]HWQ88272.1 lipid II flippase MurJ [Brevundimonas sp.]